MFWSSNTNRMILAVGVGLAIGVCTTWLFLHIKSTSDTEIAVLLDKVDQIQDNLRDLTYALMDKNKNKRSYYSVPLSSGTDEDHGDEHQEAVEPNDLNERLPPIQQPQQRQQQQNPQAALNQGNSTGAGFKGAVGANELGEKLFAETDRLMEGVDAEKQKAYHMLHHAYGQYSHNSEFLWRYAKATYNVALIDGLHGDERKKKDLTFKALDSVTKSLNINKNSPNAHKWYAITVGSAGDYLSTQERIKNGYKFKEHIDQAIALDPKDASSYYLLGRWCYGVYRLSWLERKLAATLFATPPTSTIEEAMKNFQKAQSLQNSAWKENMLFIAKCYIEKSQYKEAAEWLKKANTMPAISVDEKTAQAEIDTLLPKYRHYH